MFTMKKFAILAVAGFIASSVVACSDTTDDPEPTPQPSSSSGLSLGGNWAASGSITLGGSGNTDIGSFVDLDVNPFKIYTLTEAKTNKDKIDLIFDGANFLTPEGCDATSFCKDVNNENDAVIFVIPADASITAASSVQDIADYFEATYYDSDGDLKDGVMKTKIAATSNGKFFVATSATTPTLAFVIVDGGVTALSVNLVIGRSQVDL